MFRNWPHIISSSARAQVIRGDRANAVRLKNACCGASEVVLSFASVEPGHYVREKKSPCRCDGTLRPISGFSGCRIGNSCAFLISSLQMGHRQRVIGNACRSLGTGGFCLNVITRTYRQRLHRFRGVFRRVFLQPLPVSENRNSRGQNEGPGRNSVGTVRSEEKLAILQCFDANCLDGSRLQVAV